MKTKTSKKTRTVSKRHTAALPPVTDLHLLALLKFMSGNDVSLDYFDIQARHAAAGASALLTSEPVMAAFDSFSDRPEVSALLSVAVRAWLRTPDPAVGESKVRSAKFIEAVEKGEDLAPYHPDSIDFMDLFHTFGDSGMLMGATLMYRLLKGGDGRPGA